MNLNVIILIEQNSRLYDDFERSAAWIFHICHSIHMFRTNEHML